MPYIGAMKAEEVLYLGSIEFPSGKMVVSDPSYQRGTWCMLEDEPVGKGQWHVHVVTTDEEGWGRRPARIVLTREKDKLSADFGEKLKADIGVDSGQAGIFDSEIYHNDEKAVAPFSDLRPEEPWSSMCLQRTMDTADLCGLVPNGVVSLSGFGDGSYRLWKLKKGRRVVQWTLVFISPETDTEAI